MFSRRLGAPTAENALTQGIAAARAAGKTLIDLTATNPTAAGFSFYDAIDPAILCDPGVLSYLPSPFGPLSARESISRDYYRSQGVDIDPAELILTASTSEAYAWLFKLLCDPGDDVLVPAPGYPLFSQLAALESIETHSYPLTLSDNRWVLDLTRLRQSISTRTRAICAVSPNNPTGSCLSATDLAGLPAICAEFDLALIVDEVFADYHSPVLSDESRPSAIGIADCLTFTLNGFSKSLCLPQMKLGWIAVSGPESLRDEALSRLAFIADAYLPVNAPVALAAGELLSYRGMIQGEVNARLDANESFLRSSSANGAFDVLPREGGWYACIRIPRESAPFSLLVLDSFGVLVHPGFMYDFRWDDVIVVSLLCEIPVFVSGVERLVSLLRSF